MTTRPLPNQPQKIPTPSTAQRLAEELRQRYPERIPLIRAELVRRIEAAKALDRHRG